MTAAALPTVANPVHALATPPVSSGYLLATTAGQVASFGVPWYGSVNGALASPVVGGAETADGRGYWLAASDGGIFSFGDATFHGSTGNIRLNKPIVGMAATPDGGGYWLAASDGGIFSFGDATFHGSTGNIRLNKPIVGMTATPDGGGYWLAASDGGIFSFGDATFHGSTGNIRLNKPIVGMTATPDGGGYWLAASDGGIFSFGDATFHGSTGNIRLNKPIVGMAATPDGGGYWLAASDGGIFSFGDAPFRGSASGTFPPGQSIVALAAEPSSTPGTGAGGAPRVPQNGAYLGAWVNPVKGVSGGDTNAQSLQQVPAFAQQVGGVPAVLSIYTPFDTPPPLSQLQSINAIGAVPLISWGCTSISSVNSGQDDQTIAAYANSLKSLGQPIFLRWYWEMNLSVAKDAACLGSAGPSGFVSAWQRVWSIFHQVGATNVALVWCPGLTGLAGMAPFFPGSDYVDWVAVDGYDHSGQGQSAFAAVFGAWYQAYSGYGKPLMIGETGALPNDQTRYLQGIGSSVPTQFPGIKAIIYFDATGPAAAWQLVGAGLTAYSQLQANPYFSVRS